MINFRKNNIGAVAAFFSASFFGINFITACTSAPESIVQGPTSVVPPYPSAGIEMRNQGSLFQPASAISLYQDVPIAHRIGDKIKIEIAENSSGTNKSKTAMNRANSVMTKGPGTDDQSMNSFMRNLLNLNAEASGNDTFAGDGQTDASNSLKGKMAAAVINILPNGSLVVAGERSIALNGTINTLRFSGVVLPSDIKPGNVVASEDVMNARLEQAGKGMVDDATAKTWLQKMLTDTLLVW